MGKYTPNKDKKTGQSVVIMLPKKALNLTIAKAMELAGKLNVQFKNTIVTAHHLGTQLLKLKNGTEHGQYLPILEKIGVDPRQAQRYIKLSTIDLLKIDHYKSINEALEDLRKPEEKNKDTATETQTETQPGQKGENKQPPVADVREHIAVPKEDIIVMMHYLARTAKEMTPDTLSCYMSLRKAVFGIEE